MAAAADCNLTMGAEFRAAGRELRAAAPGPTCGAPRGLLSPGPPGSFRRRLPAVALGPLGSPRPLGIQHGGGAQLGPAHLLPAPRPGPPRSPAVG